MNGEDFRSKLREFYLNIDRPSRVEIEDDKRMSNASCIKMYLEDHTLGILIIGAFRKSYSYGTPASQRRNFRWVQDATSTSTHS